jgi:hypothetical protein
MANKLTIEDLEGIDEPVPEGLLDGGQSSGTDFENPVTPSEAEQSAHAPLAVVRHRDMKIGRASGRERVCLRV